MESPPKVKEVAPPRNATDQSNPAYSQKRYAWFCQADRSGRGELMKFWYRVAKPSPHRNRYSSFSGRSTTPRGDAREDAEGRRNSSAAAAARRVFRIRSPTPP
jgi:hypothetical protein